MFIFLFLFSGDSRRQLTVGKMMSPWSSNSSGGGQKQAQWQYFVSGACMNISYILQEYIVAVQHKVQSLLWQAQLTTAQSKCTTLRNPCVEGRVEPLPNPHIGGVRVERENPHPHPFLSCGTYYPLPQSCQWVVQRSTTRLGRVQAGVLWCSWPTLRPRPHGRAVPAGHKRSRV